MLFVTVDNGEGIDGNVKVFAVVQDERWVDDNMTFEVIGYDDFHYCIVGIGGCRHEVWAVADAGFCSCSSIGRKVNALK